MATLFYRLVNAAPVAANQTLQKVGSRTNQAGKPIYPVALVVTYPEADPTANGGNGVWYDDVLFALRPQGINNVDLNFQDSIELAQMGFARSRLGNYAATQRIVQPFDGLEWATGRELELHLQTFTHPVPARAVSVLLICKTEKPGG